MRPSRRARARAFEVARALALALALALAATGCRVERPGRTPSGHARDIVFTAVPLLTKEMATIYPFLQKDFAPGGVLYGKEVYGFMPSTVTVQEGDTLRLQLVNPEDDAHNFVLGDLNVPLPGQTTTRATWVAHRAGVFPFFCTIPAHLPFMWGQIVVLPRDAFRPGY